MVAHYFSYSERYVDTCLYGWFLYAIFSCFFFIRVVLVGMVDGRRMGLGGFLHHAYVGTYVG